MTPQVPRRPTTPEEAEAYYEYWAGRYLRSLTLENIMEGVPQATQREITLESLRLVTAPRPDVHVFNELLVQYPVRGQDQPGQVVPDNMVVVHAGPLTVKTNYAVALQPARPFWVLEYVSKGHERKDYELNMRKYDRDLKVPYYLIFYPDTQDLTLFRRGPRKYAAVTPNDAERYPIAELDLEVAILDGWVRYWFRGQLLRLPVELQRHADEGWRRAEEATRRAEEAARRADEQFRQAEQLREQLRQAEEARRALEAELARLRGGAPPPAA